MSIDETLFMGYFIFFIFFKPKVLNLSIGKMYIAPFTFHTVGQSRFSLVTACTMVPAAPKTRKELSLTDELSMLVCSNTVDTDR